MVGRRWRLVLTIASVGAGLVVGVAGCASSTSRPLRCAVVDRAFVRSVDAALGRRVPSVTGDALPAPVAGDVGRIAAAYARAARTGATGPPRGPALDRAVADLRDAVPWCA
jgi:hypothetical protein